MLNVDQHNKKVKKKMTLEDFIKNNRGINDGKDIPEPLLRAIFDDIANNELKMKEEDHQQFFSGGKFSFSFSD
jgi:brefeldin A-inhibited guanine nucleotide-exchange protein